MGKVDAITAVEEAKRLILAANQQGLTLRLMGGVAIWLHSEKGDVPKELIRDYVDLDFFSLSKEVAMITRFFIDMGYEPNRRFNAVLGSVRLLFSSSGEVDHIDILLDQLHMCHTWDLRRRVSADEQTLPLADLLLTKLQIVKLTEKDIKDICLLLLQHDLGQDDHEQINISYLEKLLGGDWGLWKTVSINLGKIDEYLEGFQFDRSSEVAYKVGELDKILENADKSLRWKLRSIVGERIQWYELPGEVQQ